MSQVSPMIEGKCVSSIMAKAAQLVDNTALDVHEDKSMLEEVDKEDDKLPYSLVLTTIGT